MPISPYEYVLMNELAYNYPSQIQLPPALIEEGWQLIAVSYNPLTLPFAPNYFGLAFRQGNQIVIAHRRSVFHNPKNIHADKLIADDELPVDIIAECCEFVDRVVVDFMTQNDTLIFTGHGSGGFLAVYTAVCYCFKGAHFEAVTFDAVGSKVILEQCGFSYEADKIQNYFSVPNLLNTVKHHIGHLKKIFTPYDEFTRHMRLMCIQNVDATIRQNLTFLQQNQLDVFTALENISRVIFLTYAANTNDFSRLYTHPLEIFKDVFGTSPQGSLEICTRWPYHPLGAWQLIPPEHYSIQHHVLFSPEHHPPLQDPEKAALPPRKYFTS